MKSCSLQKLLLYFQISSGIHVSTMFHICFFAVCMLAFCMENSLLTYSKSRITVDGLDQFFTLMAYNPVRVILGCPFGI